MESLYHPISTKSVCPSTPKTHSPILNLPLHSITQHALSYSVICSKILSAHLQLPQSAVHSLAVCIAGIVHGAVMPREPGRSGSGFTRIWIFREVFFVFAFFVGRPWVGAWYTAGHFLVIGQRDIDSQGCISRY